MNITKELPVVDPKTTLENLRRQMERFVQLNLTEPQNIIDLSVFDFAIEFVQTHPEANKWFSAYFSVGGPLVMKFVCKDLDIEVSIFNGMNMIGLTWINSTWLEPIRRRETYDSKEEFLQAYDQFVLNWLS